MPTPGQAIANAWAAQVVVNGGAAPAASSIAAQAAGADIIVAAGIQGKIVTFNSVAPDSIIAAFTPLIDNNGVVLYSSDVALGAINPAALTVNGYVPNFGGTTHYVNPGATPSTCTPALTAASNGCTIYSTGAGESQTLGQCGCHDGAGGRLQISIFDPFVIAAGIGIMFQQSAAAPNIWLSHQATSGQGCYSLNRTSSTRSSLYLRTSTIYNARLGANWIDTELQAVPTTPFIFGGFNANGAIGTSGEINSGQCLHQGLTAAEAEQLTLAMQTIRVGYGGGFL